MLAGLGRGAVAVAFEQPLAVVGDGELAHAGAELLEGGEALEPEDLLLEGLDELLRAAVGLGLVVVGRRAGDPEVAACCFGSGARGRLSLRFNAPSAGYYLQRLDRQGQTDAGCWSTEVRVEATGSPAANT